MGQMNHLVGIIELDADPDLDTPLDENIGQTLRRLNRCEEANSPYSSGIPCWHEADDCLPDSIVVLKADLGQLRYELESELAKLLDRLLLCQ